MSEAVRSERAMLIANARAWASHDPDPKTKRALERLVARGDLAELASCMTPLEFGTAGLRGLEGPGPGRMNLAVVRRTAAGLARDVLGRVERSTRPMLVVGYDARKNSEKYAQTVVGVLVAAGLEVRYFKLPTPTPLVAYAARRLGAQAAVCVTASHNPRQYAGLKVYADNAVQIVVPRDAEIASAIAEQGPADGIAVCSSAELSDSPHASSLEDELVEGYYEEVLAARTTAEAYPLRIVYTPLHGVGGRYMMRLLDRAGYHDVHPVMAQFEPDAQFPTLHFPNPEEPGTLDLALDLARQTQADLVLANDPDADRLAVAVPSVEGSFRMLTGNQLGLLLADYLLARIGVSAPKFVVSSIVSSPMLESIARRRTAKVYRTLTGFKWMLNAALAIEQEGEEHFVFGFEEALGYAIRGPVLDKDGLSAGLLFADLVGEDLGNGRTVLDRLAELYAEHGLWVSCLHSVVLKDATEMRRAQVRLRHLAAAPPARLSGLAVEAVTDYTSNVDQRPWYLGYADMLEFRLQDGSRVIARPSGTEPKLKIYADSVQPYRPGELLREQERGAEKRAEQLAQSLACLLASA